MRIADNPALFHALATGHSSIAVFVINPKQHQLHGEAPAKLEFIKAHINDLVLRLVKLGVKSIVQSLPTYDDVPAFFNHLCQKLAVSAVYHNKSYLVNEQHRDQQVSQILHTQQIPVHQYHANYLLPPRSVSKTDGSMYHVFTPYKNRFIEQMKANYQLPYAIPEALSEVLDEEVLNEPYLGEFEHTFSVTSHSAQMISMWPIGEVEAVNRLKEFVNNNDYQRARDFPAIDGTSSVSPYLAIGVLSANQCLAYALKAQGEGAFYSTWVSELIWRDFYNDLVFEYPKLVKHQTFKSQAVDNWRDDLSLLNRWQTGQTGFPIVDAGMRQLLQEGWMHNRVRMVVASFLSKLCLIDWRLGEAHFMAHLLDGDLASNNGGWQWSSATGCDAAPYFRIFNPTTQSKKFDKAGVYIRKYVPELAQVDSQEIHEPKVETRSACKYPEPVIDYKAARADALSWFKERIP